jgi:hypothetical protein
MHGELLFVAGLFNELTKMKLRCCRAVRPNKKGIPQSSACCLLLASFLLVLPFDPKMFL